MQFSKREMMMGAFFLVAIVLIFLFANNSGTAPSNATPPITTNTENNETSANTDPSKTITPSTTTAPPESSTTVSPSSKPPATLSGRIAPDFVQPTGFSNTDTLGLVNTNTFTLKQYFGKKVILLDFWTTSSMNSLRTVPYLNQWNTKYRDHGLMIVTIHSPRFTFERSKSIVDQYANAHNMIFPIVIDNEYGTWSAYKNTLWPHQYLIDMNGRIVYDHAGEGGYDTMEAKIRSLLNLRLGSLGKPALPYDNSGAPADVYPVDLSKVLSSEVYFGAARNQSLLGGIAQKVGPQSFAPLSTAPKLNLIAPTGGWNFTQEYAQSMAEGSKMTYRYSAKSVYGVFGAEGTIRVKVLLDGQPLTETNMGKDVRIEKNESVVYVTQERIYDIIKGTSYGERTIELIAPSGGLNLYTLTFG